MLKTGLFLIGLAVLVLGFAGGMYYERELVPHQPEPVVIPPYEPRTQAAPPGAGEPNADLGAEAARRDLSEILGETEPFARAEHLATKLKALGPGDTSAILAVMQDPKLDLTAPDYALLVQRWAQLDVTAAARWAAYESPTAQRGAVIYPAIEELARRDPQAALGLAIEVDRIPNSYSTLMQLALVRGWYDGGKEGLEDYIYNLGVGPIQQRAMVAFARRAIMRDGPDKIMHWATSLPDQDKKFKIMAFRQIGSELATLQPQAALAWCEAVCDGPFGNSVRSLIAQRWAAQDGYATMAWLEKTPAGTERDWAVEAALRGWMSTRPQEFDAWLNKQTQNGSHIERWLTPAVGQYPAFLVRDPERPEIEDALAWASRIEDPQQRWRSLVTVARVWYKRDPEAANAWIEQSELDEKGRAAARGTLNAKPGEAGSGETGSSDPAAGAADPAAQPDAS